MRVAVIGAGCIGAWTGGWLAHAGAKVTLIGRPWLAEAVAADRLTVIDLAGRTAHPDLTLATQPAAVARAELVLCTTKSGDTAAAAAAIAPHLHPDAVVVSLQNGLRNPDLLRHALPDHTVLAGMVSFNVIAEGATFRQTTSGPIAFDDHAYGDPLADALAQVHIPTERPDDMTAVQWAKLVLNLNNAVNALSGLPLAQQLADRGYRRVVATAMREAWAALDAAGVKPTPIGRMRPRLAPRILPLPDLLFRLAAAPMLKVDPAARSSMLDDLTRGRTTEVGELQGEVVALGAAHGVPTPVNAHLMALVRAAEAAGAGSPRLPPSALWPEGPVS